MLRRLTITNFALIEHLAIEFGDGLHIVTGETGAGKSILIDALGLALGERADTTMIRTGAERSVIEAEFATLPERGVQLLRALAIDELPVLILRREITTKGVSRCFINDSPVTVAQLKSLGDHLIDIHGQHEHQSLLRPETHGGILDAFADIEADRISYLSAYTNLLHARRDLSAALDAQAHIEERRIIIEHQLRAIEAIDPRPDEDVEIERELAIAEHAERIGALIAGMLTQLYDGEPNAMDQIGHARRMLSELERIDPAVAPMQEQLELAGSQVRDVASTLRTTLERIDVSPDQCERMRARLAAITSLKRSMRSTLPELIARRADLAAEREQLATIDHRIAELERDCATHRAAASERAILLSQKRAEAAQELAKRVVRELTHLGMPRCRFEARLTRHPAAAGDGLLCDGRSVHADEQGIDDIEFFIATNVGEDLKPLARTASGGEVSRIMLALKTLPAGRGAVPVMVFDEIDVGVSGAIAARVGEAMQRLARTTQIIAITHLPQIAAMGERHHRVEKRPADGRTTTTITPLTGEERVSEVARLISGSTVSEAARASARELFQHE